MGVCSWGSANKHEGTAQCGAVRQEWWRMGRLPDKCKNQVRKYPQARKTGKDSGCKNRSLARRTARERCGPLAWQSAGQEGWAEFISQHLHRQTRLGRRSCKPAGRPAKTLQMHVTPLGAEAPRPSHQTQPTHVHPSPTQVPVEKVKLP